jgi:ABC-type uncharacterized transport system involved in gliding motility auxiliary subunit
VEDLLGEFRQASRGQIEIQKLDPVPDSDAEDSAKLDGIEGQSRLDGEPIYLGVSVSMLDQKEAIPFLSPDQERLLEYELSRAISRVMTPQKPVLGVMSPLPVSGQQMNPMMMRMGQRGQRPWVFMSELQRDFTVKTIEMTVDKIADDVTALVLIHPKAISDAAQYAIDQFVLRGGKLLAFLDPMSVLDPQASQMSQFGMGGSSSSSLEKLLKAWGLTFDPTKVVADLDYVARTRQGRAPTALALNDKAMNKDDVLTAGIDNLFYVFGGAFSGTPIDGLKETVLIKSSKNSQPKPAESKPEEPKPDGQKPEEKKPEPPAEQGLKESAQENVVILIGDCDMIQDQIAVTEAMNPFGGQRVVMPANGNLAFVQGAIEQLTGDINLMAVRSRASRERPFTEVTRRQSEAESNYRSKIKELETSLAEAQRKLNELQQTKKQEGGQRFILSPEQQQEIANFRKKEGEVKQQLKQERKKLRASIDALENRIKWLNIAGMPLLVSGAGVALAMVRRKRRAAR